MILKLDFEKAYDKIQWSFLEEVMRSKGFSNSWIDQVMGTVRDGKVSININGEIGPYFKTYRGLRQGDPLSPLLFNLAADALAEIIRTAQDNNLLRGLISHLVPGGVPILQYADDTVLMLEFDETAFLNLKFLLYCFEWMLGLKINYHKSELFVMGGSEEDSARAADIFDCKLASLPMTYLGILIGDRQIGVRAADLVINKLT